MEQQKKVYTMEDNVKYISFGIKDLVKELQSLNQTMVALVEKLEKTSDSNNIPF
jgi:hypothetical protein